MEAPLAYQHRAKPYSQKARFEMQPGHLAVTQGGRSGDFAYRDILMVRSSTSRATPANEGYQAKLSAAGPQDGRATNLSWRSLVDLERQDADISAFVRALVRPSRRTTRPSFWRRASHAGFTP